MFQERPTEERKLAVRPFAASMPGELLIIARTQLGLALVYLGVDSSSPETRKNVQSMLSASTAKMPELTNKVVREALTVYLSRPVAQAKPSALLSDERAPPPVNKQNRLSGLLLSAIPCNNEVDSEVRDDILVQYITLSHHPLVCESPNCLFSIFQGLNICRWRSSANMD